MYETCMKALEEVGTFEETISSNISGWYHVGAKIILLFLQSLFRTNTAGYFHLNFVAHN